MVCFSENTFDVFCFFLAICYKFFSSTIIIAHVVFLSQHGKDTLFHLQTHRHHGIN